MGRGGTSSFDRSLVSIWYIVPRRSSALTVMVVMVGTGGGCRSCMGRLGGECGLLSARKVSSMGDGGDGVLTLDGGSGDIDLTLDAVVYACSSLRCRCDSLEWL